MTQPLSNPKEMSSAERVAAINAIRTRILEGGDVSEEQIRWGQELLITERSDAAKSRRKENANARSASISLSTEPALEIKAEDL